MKRISLIILLVITTCAHCCRNGIIIRQHELTPAEKQEITHTHNRLRHCIALGSMTEECADLKSQRQPNAKNMRKMEWDEALAESAQAWADQCVFAHNKNYDPRFQCVGQNLGISWSSRDDGGRPEFESTIQRWFDEQKDYTYTRHKYSFPKLVGHYTQVVWADTFKVGCGYSYYREGMWFKKLHVCNYGPCGNFIGDYPYQSGRPACHQYNLNYSSIMGLCE